MADMVAGDIGRPIDVTTDENVSSATTLEIYVQSPTGASKKFTAAVHPTDNLTVRYTTASADDIPPGQHGTWKGQARVVLPDGSDRRTDPPDTFEVGERL